MVNNSNAYSTQLDGPEPVEELCSKTVLQLKVGSGSRKTLGREATNKERKRG